jgi:ribosome-binding protein aMBF1 (putative translation factor)
MYVFYHIIFLVAKGDVMKTLPYKKAIAPKKHAAGSDLGKFSAALKKQLQKEYELTFGLGELMSSRRQELQMSQSELAEETGIPQADISRIECGHANPTLKTVEKLLNALDLRITISRQ